MAKTFFDQNESREDENNPEILNKEKILEHQLRLLHEEVKQLSKEKYAITYTVSWLIVSPLLYVETLLSNTYYAVINRLKPSNNVCRHDVRCVTLATSKKNATRNRILIDVTGTTVRDMATGIERVTKGLSKALTEVDKENCIIVTCDNGRFLRYSPSKIRKTNRSVEIIQPIAGDRLFVLSDPWNYPEHYSGIFQLIHNHGGSVYLCLHDVIPEMYPMICHERTVRMFRPWLREVLQQVDGIITVSKSSANDLMEIISSQDIAHSPDLKIGWFHNSTNFENKIETKSRFVSESIFSSQFSVFAIVATLEPRKGHMIAIDAFGQLWEKGYRVKLLIVGERGWFDFSIVSRIQNHSEYNRQLYWLRNVSDAELSYIYSNMTALLFPSFAEGFGLPIIEASHYGKPVICSDIPVFREIARDGAIFFHVNNANDLCEKIIEYLEGRRIGNPENVLNTTWIDAAHRVIDAIKEDEWEYTLNSEGR